MGMGEEPSLSKIELAVGKEEKKKKKIGSIPKTPLYLPPSR